MGGPCGRCDNASMTDMSVEARARRDGAGPDTGLSAVQIAPSILAADQARLADEVEAVLAAGARVIHVDVMDGHFVPPITMGALVVDSLREQVHEAGALLDVHLMVDQPERHVADFASAGADVITIHVEATPHVHRTLAMIAELGCRAGLALNPATPVEHALPAADLVDLVLCMTVNPGWGGQSFIGSSPPRIAQLRRLLPETVVIEVDGGIAEATVAACREAGATLLVAGSSVFGGGDPAGAFRRLSQSID